MYRFSFFASLLLFSSILIAQEDDLMALLDDGQSSDDFVTATFKSTRLVNGHSVEIRNQKNLEFVISHRFGPVNDGSYGFWGLDGANIRIALEYGLAKNLNVGLGRSSYEKTYDIYGKYRVMRQSGSNPVTITAFGSWAFATDSLIEAFERSHRSFYTGQLLIARKINSKLSLQLVPTLIQRNYVPTRDDENGLIALGIGGRYKLSNRVALNAEYYPQVTDYNDSRFDSIAIGFDIETGGHVFQLHFTNATQMIEKGFIGETINEFSGKEIRFGFNITRTFELGNKELNW